MTSHAVIIGDSPVGEALARTLAADDESAVLLSGEEDVVASARSAGVEVLRADPAEAATLDRPEVVDAESAIVVAETDGKSLLVTQLLRVRDTDRVIALVNDPRNLDAFADAGVEAVCAVTTLAAALAARHGAESSPAGDRSPAEDRSPAGGRVGDPTRDPDGRRVASDGTSPRDPDGRTTECGDRTDADSRSRDGDVPGSG